MGAPVPQMTHKPADFMPEDTTPPGTPASNQTKPGERGGNVIRWIPSDLHRASV